MKYLLSIVFSASSCMIMAQSNIVESLQTTVPGQGKVTVHQDAQISAMIGKRFVPTGTSEAQRVIKSRGYRVQVYAGNNSRQARDEANAVAEKVKEKFPDMPVYTFFQPRLPVTHSRSAIRVATPLVTCSSLRHISLSSTSQSTSIPLLAGPGCITIAPLFAIAILSIDTP